MPDLIHIEALEIRARIGVPEAERAEPQRLTVTLTLEPKVDFRTLQDRIEAAVDYAAVCETVKTVAAARPRRLIETLAAEIAAATLTGYPLRRVEVEVRKFILPDTAHVAVRIVREA